MSPVSLSDILKAVVALVVLAAAFWLAHIWEQHGKG